MTTTNYFDTFIEVAEDCPASQAEIPPIKGEKKSVANLQFEMVFDHPYRYTSDDVFFHVFATRKELPEGEMEEQRTNFFSKGQPCFRASPLTKRYGWGVHSNEEGKVALYSRESAEYKAFVEDEALKTVKAMRSKKA